ncbi:MAG: hypothetical protein ACP5MH_10880 [Thermoproteus sp.]
MGSAAVWLRERLGSWCYVYVVYRRGALCSAVVKAHDGLVLGFNRREVGPGDVRAAVMCGEERLSKSPLATGAAGIAVAVLMYVFLRTWLGSLAYAVAIALGLAAAYLSFHILIFLCCAVSRRGASSDPELEKIAGEAAAILNAEVGDAVQLAGRTYIVASRGSDFRGYAVRLVDARCAESAGLPGATAPGS